MKNLMVMCMAFLLLVGCKSNLSTNVDNKTEVMLKGNWILTAVTYPGSEYIKVNSFDLADSQCFVGSTWKFISNNNKGEMALTKSDCPMFSSPITWFVNQEGNFVMKVLNAGEKASKIRDGYVLKVDQVSANSFQLIDRISIGGKLTDVVYQFQRV